MSFKIELHTELTQITTREDTSLGIMRWGVSNSYPQTLKNLIEQSPTARPAVDRTAKFLKGSGFEGEDTVVSPYGITLKDVVSILADDYAMYHAFAIHCNFNLEGKVVSIIPMRISDLRFNRFDELNYASKIGFYYNWGRNDEVKKTIDTAVTKEKIKWFNRFNPSAVIKQIENEDGKSLIEKIGNYQGQMLYFAESGFSNYPIPPLQAPINFVLSDVENSILVRKETSTGFISSYLLKTTLDSEDPTLIALQDALEEAQGARGTGKIVMMTNLAPEDVTATVLEEIGGGAAGKQGIIESATKAYELTSKIINGAYQIPPILAGNDQRNGFSGTDLDDAYYVFNAVTQNGRDTIEAELNKVLKNSTFNVEPIEINKLQLDAEELTEVEAKK